MIVFKGELSEETKMFVVKNEAHFARTVAYFFAVPIIIVGIVLLISTRDMVYLLIPFAAVIYVLLFGARPGKKSYDLIMPTCITIEDNMLTTEGNKFRGSIEMRKVKKVIDYGNWYKIAFTFPKVQRFICQKDLIVEGTIEEFEALFKDKIIRHYKK